MSNGPLTARDDHALLTVRLTPNARDDTIESVRALADGRNVLAVRVRAIPADGAANTALIALLSKTLSAPKSRISIITGHTQRIKIVRIDLPGTEVAEKLAL